MVHQSHKIPSLTEEVVRLAQAPEVKRAEELQARVERLELDLDIQRSRTVKMAIALLLAGLFLGALLAGMLGRRQNGP